ncbi:AraC family transcriptional regulator [uncultured Aquimarina sp.]|uniref:helix-turn-helix domain-containing protein n=1 Tax=uncultured Aquimarina sp. TaxID=575652 RepID=UPI0026095180|nr:helix-turn-helix domain-containing protein [uncultured Aquimarina sp.]
MLPFFYRSIKYKSLNWLTIFCGICILLNFVRQLRFTLESVYFIHIVFDALALFTLYYITIASLVQINILNITGPENEEEEIELKEVFLSINNYISINKSYLNPSMNLKMFASEVQLPERIISKAINKIENKNFNNYVNYHRIEEFKDKIASDYHKKYSISAIANEVGFNSRASFYKNFKDIVGVSPSEYVERVSS